MRNESARANTSLENRAAHSVNGSRERTENKTKNDGCTELLVDLGRTHRLGLSVSEMET